MRMKTNQPWGYLAPEIEVVEIAVEQGFAGSEGGNMENPDERPDQPW